MIVIDEQPILMRWQTLRQIAQIGTGAAGHIDGLHHVVVRKRIGDDTCQLRRPGAEVGGLAEGEPAGAEVAHYVAFT